MTRSGYGIVRRLTASAIDDIRRLRAGARPMTLSTDQGCIG
jgi:hypothetical protein